MKKLSFLAAVLMLTSFSSTARARIPVCFPCEYIETIMDLPADTEFIGESEDPLNIGYRFEQINILWIPIWNYEGVHCLVNDAEDTSYELSAEEKAYLTEKHQASFDGSPLGLWDKIGGKAIIAVILLFIIWSYLPGRKEDEEPDSGTNA